MEVQKHLIVIAGATASGKTELAIRLAEHFNTEILSADSRQCYRELNIGVAKPTPFELSRATHHFINSHSIHEPVSAGIYERFGMNILQQLFDKHKIVICVGGTGMYIRALTEGIDEMPEVPQQISDNMDAMYREKGLAWLMDAVKNADPDFMHTKDEHNPARLLRALSFIEAHGKSITHYRIGNPKPRPFQTHLFALDLPRTILYERINVRVDQMIHAGLEAEVESLKPYLHLKPLQTVGYSEWIPYFNQQQSKEECIQLIKQHSRNYAKRQITWFKHQGQYTWMTANELFQHLSLYKFP
jgi:tRNA dimethylallyltransferase